MNVARRLACLATLALAVMITSPAFAQSKADPAEWVPGDALFYAGCTDTAQLWTDFKKTSIYTLIQDPDAKTMYEPVTQAAKKIKERLASVLDVSPDQLDNPFAGPAAIFMTVPAGKTGEDAAPAAILTVGRKDLMRQYYDSAVRKLRDTAANHESVSAGSHKIDAFTGVKKPGTGNQDESEKGGRGGPQDEGFDEHGDEGENSPEQMVNQLLSGEILPENVAVCLTDDRLYVAQTADDVKGLLRQEDKSKAVAGSEDYRDGMRLFKEAGAVRFMVNLPRIFELERRENPEAEKTLAALGTKSMRSIVGHSHVGGSNFDSRTEAVLLTSGEPTGLTKIFTMKNGPVAPKESVPGSATIFVSLNVDPPKLVDDIEGIVRQFDPAAADQMRASMESTQSETGETISIRKDLIENLRPPLNFYMAFTTPYGAQSARMILSLGLKSREALDKIIPQLAPQGMVTPRDVRGTQVFDSMFGVSAAASTDALFIGNTAAVESALQGAAADSLAADQAFRKAAQAVPQEAWATFYMDMRRFIEAMVGLTENKEEVAAAGMTNPANMMAMSMAEGFSGQGQPSPEQMRRLARFYGPLIMTIGTIPEGVKITYVQIKPDGQ